MAEITKATAQEIIRLTEGLGYCRERLKEVDTAESVTVVVKFVKSTNSYGGKDYGTLKLEENCSSSQSARSAAAGVRQYWERRRDDYIRRLRQIGAEVPHG